MAMGLLSDPSEELLDSLLPAERKVVLDALSQMGAVQRIQNTHPLQFLGTPAVPTVQQVRNREAGQSQVIGGDYVLGSRDFGMHMHPKLKRMKMHSGHDISRTPSGQSVGGKPVLSFRDGVVTFAGPKGGYGNRVEVRHPDGTTTAYSHLREGLRVKKDDKVSAGQPLGRVGSTGLSTGDHLHFEVLNAEDRYIDPRSYLNETIPAKALKSPAIRDQIAAAGVTPDPAAVGINPGARRSIAGTRGMQDFAGTGPLLSAPPPAPPVTLVDIPGSKKIAQAPRSDPMVPTPVQTASIMAGRALPPGNIPPPAVMFGRPAPAPPPNQFSNAPPTVPAAPPYLPERSIAAPVLKSPGQRIAENYPEVPVTTQTVADIRRIEEAARQKRGQITAEESALRRADQRGAMTSVLPGNVQGVGFPAPPPSVLTAAAPVGPAPLSVTAAPQPRVQPAALTGAMPMGPAPLTVSAAPQPPETPFVVPQKAGLGLGPPAAAPPYSPPPNQFSNIAPARSLPAQPAIAARTPISRPDRYWDTPAPLPRPAPDVRPVPFQGNLPRPRPEPVAPPPVAPPPAIAARPAPIPAGLVMPPERPGPRTSFAPSSIPPAATTVIEKTMPTQPRVQTVSLPGLQQFAPIEHRQTTALPLVGRPIPSAAVPTVAPPPAAPPRGPIAAPAFAPAAPRGAPAAGVSLSQALGAIREAYNPQIGLGTVMQMARKAPGSLGAIKGVGSAISAFTDPIGRAGRAAAPALSPFASRVAADMGMTQMAQMAASAMGGGQSMGGGGVTYNGGPAYSPSSYSGYGMAGGPAFGGGFVGPSDDRVRGVSR